MGKAVVRDAVEALCGKINTALQGENTHEEIERAVYEMLTSLNVPVNK